jgi:hypothetical protein
MPSPGTLNRAKSSPGRMGCRQWQQQAIVLRSMGSPPAPRLVFFVGQLVLDRFQVLVGLLQAGAGLVDGPEDGNVVDSDADFELMFPEEFLNEDDLFSQSLLWRVVGHRIHLPYEVVPGGVANDRNALLAFLPEQEIDIGSDECDKQ